MHDKLRFHIERQTTANIAAGLAPEQARRRTSLAQKLVSRPIFMRHGTLRSCRRRTIGRHNG
jgi:hypothetical protein